MDLFTISQYNLFAETTFICVEAFQFGQEWVALAPPLQLRKNEAIWYRVVVASSQYHEQKNTVTGDN